VPATDTTIDQHWLYVLVTALTPDAMTVLLARRAAQDGDPGGGDVLSRPEVARRTGMSLERVERADAELERADLYRWVRTHPTKWHYTREATWYPGRFGRVRQRRPGAPRVCVPARLVAAMHARPAPAATPSRRPAHVVPRPQINRKSSLPAERELHPPTPQRGAAGGPPGPDTPARPATAPARALRPPGRPGRTRRQPRTPAPPPPPQAVALAAAVGVPQAAPTIAVALAAGWPVQAIRTALDGVAEGHTPPGLAKHRIDGLMAGPPPPPPPRQRVRSVPHCGSPLCRAGTRKIIDYDTGAELGDCSVCSPYVAVAQHTVSVSGQALRAGPSPVTVAEYPVLSTAYRTAKEHPHGRTV
jgi:hypothetical protein